ncbi:MAG: aminopeptidase P family protein, partial [Dinoroseobacter sp.]|nr:aminopeptidase P family protein [Dinoroseobacter sp.]
MNTHYRDTRKIDPSRGATLGDGSAIDAYRIEIGRTELAFREFETAGIELPNLANMRQFRLDRLVSHVAERDYGGILMFDPLN